MLGKVESDHAVAQIIERKSRVFSGVGIVIGGEVSFDAGVEL